MSADEGNPPSTETTVPLAPEVPAVPLAPGPAGITKIVDGDDSGDDRKPHVTPKWQQFAWFLGICLLFLTMIFLLYTVWDTADKVMKIVSDKKWDQTDFIFAGMSLVNVTLIRMIAVLAGTAVAFTGLAISFFSHDKATNLAAVANDENKSQVKAALTAYSPGIVGVIIGAAIIITALLAQGKYQYNGGKSVTLKYAPEFQDSQSRDSAADSIGMPSIDQISGVSQQSNADKPESSHE